MAIFHIIDLAADVKKYLLKVQGEAKEKKGICKFSLQKTIEQIVREHKKYRKKEAKSNQSRTASLLPSTEHERP